MPNYSEDFQITQAGLYLDMPETLYHADPCPTPSLSNSIIRTLLDQSPLHAAYKHPRLYGQNNNNPTKAMTKGTLLHTLLLEAGQNIVIIDADDYRGKKAREEKEQALAENKTPVLARDYDLVSHCAEITRKNIANHPACEGFLNPGISEATIAWQEGNVWCRGRLDRLPDHNDFPVFDLKGTELSASPTTWEKRLCDVYRTQGAFYNRGLKAVGKPRKQPMRYIVVELYEPFAMNVFCPSEELINLANDEIDRAIRLWSHCITHNQWPGYTDHIIEVDPKPWTITQIFNEQYQDELRGY